MIAGTPGPDNAELYAEHSVEVRIGADFAGAYTYPHHD